MRKHCWQNYPSSQPQKLKTLPAKDRHGRNVRTIYIILVFSFRAEAKLQKKKKTAFLGEGMDIKWEQRNGAGLLRAQLRVKLKVKGLQQEQHQDEAEARLEVEGFSMLPYSRSLCQSLS